jgi:hypothetical protein
MSFSEVAYRARQEASKMVERTRPVMRSSAETLELFKRRVPEFADGAGALERFRSVVQHRFFAGATQPSTIPGIRAASPEACAAIVAAAARVTRRRFDLLGYSQLAVGDPVDWHRDPVSGRRAPDLHWTRIDPLDADLVGDSKLTWELSRQQWLVTLAQAHHFTGDARYLRAAAELFDDWIAANPPDIGINWTSSLELAYRAIAWCWAIVLFRQTPFLTPERFVAAGAGLWSHMRHVERYLSRYFSPNTHLTGEALGLFYAGIVSADRRDAARWRDLGREILINEIRRQILADGGYFEQASCYHRYTVEIYLHFLILAERNGIAVPDDVGAAIGRMVEWLISMSMPNHTLPAIGDADGGVALPLVRRAPNDSRAVSAVAAAWFGRPDFGWASGGATSEVLWLLGRAGLVDVGHLGVRVPAWPPSQVFSASGYAVMRSDWQAEAHQLLLDAGPLGCPVSGAHGHADLLSIQCTAFGEEYLVDPGTYCYTPQPQWRNHFRSTAAHNTVRVDHQDQALPAGPFSWQMRPTARIEAWESTATHDFADASHDGYARLSQPVQHRRRVLFVKPRGWVVVDDLTGAGEHQIELRFHFSPRPVTLRPDGWTRAQGRRGRGLWLRPLARFTLTGDCREGQCEPIDGWISPGYGVRCPAPVVVFSATVAVPARIVTVILPVESLTEEPPDLVATDDDGMGADVMTLQLPDDDRLIRIAAESLTIDDGGQRQRIA